MPKKNPKACDHAAAEAKHRESERAVRALLAVGAPLTRMVLQEPRATRLQAWCTVTCSSCGAAFDTYRWPRTERREREAQALWRSLAFTDKHRAPPAGSFDPLEVRLGMRAWCSDSRGGWSVSNPLYHRTLREHPRSDESLPGPAWLRQVYGWRHFEHVTLPGVRALLRGRREAIERRHAEQRAAQSSTPPAAPAPQGELFR